MTRLFEAFDEKADRLEELRRQLAVARATELEALDRISSLNEDARRSVARYTTAEMQRDAARRELEAERAARRKREGEYENFIDEAAAASLRAIKAERAVRAEAVKSARREGLATAVDVLDARARQAETHAQLCNVSEVIRGCKNAVAKLHEEVRPEVQAVGKEPGK